MQQIKSPYKDPNAYLYCVFCGERMQFTRELAILNEEGYQRGEIWICPGCDSTIHCSPENRRRQNVRRLKEYRPENR